MRVVSEDVHVSWTELVSHESVRFHFPRGVLGIKAPPERGTFFRLQIYKRVFFSMSDESQI